MKQKLFSIFALLLTAVTQGAWAQSGMTNGLFSVSATKKVCFSKGNLQLVGENTFQFAENQWDYFGSNQSDNHRDLFSWGTGNDPNQTTGNSTFTDWGDNTYLQATLGKGWRTMTQDEFAYVFNTRASGSSVFGNANGRYTTATINTDGTGVNGLILFPDGITIAASEVTTAGTINSKGTVTQCTTAQWAALAEKGCVFLPAAGFFVSGEGTGYGTITDYWSSTAVNASKAYNLSFNFGYSQATVNTTGSLAYKYGCSVRLVFDGIMLDKNEAQMTIGNAMTLTATVVTPTGDKTVTWTTSDASVATVADGVVTAVAAGTATITATATNGTADTSDDKTATCTVTVSNPTVTANEGATGEYWATYYNGTTSFMADENTTVFQAALSGSSLTLTEVPNREIPATKAVILKSSSATITLTPASTTETLEGNELQGTATSITNPGNAYVLNKTATNGVGFYKLSSTGTIGANKAYLTYSGASQARSFFGFDETTGIEMPTAEVIDTDAVVYDLQGRRVAQPTKGLYIVNGKKVFINK